jgi:cbb3-type cytochrome oxidase subunit 3
MKIETEKAIGVIYLLIIVSCVIAFLFKGYL